MFFLSLFIFLFCFSYHCTNKEGGINRCFHIMKSVSPLRGFVKLKKIKKSEKKLWLIRHHPPTPLSNFFFFWKNKNNTKNTQVPKKNWNLSWGLTSHRLPSFWNYFNLTKPLTSAQHKTPSQRYTPMSEVCPILWFIFYGLYLQMD